MIHSFVALLPIYIPVTILPKFILLTYLKREPFYSCRFTWHLIYQQIYKPFLHGTQNRFVTSICIFTFFFFPFWKVYKSNKLIIRYGWEVWKLILHILLYREFNTHLGFTHRSVLGMYTDLVLLLFYACRFLHF